MARWGLGYFRVNQEGHVTAHPGSGAAEGVDLYRLAMDLTEQGVRLPVLLRFSDILRARIGEVAEAFTAAIDEFDYRGRHSLVYPIKVNQQRHVVAERLEIQRHRRSSDQGDARRGETRVEADRQCDCKGDPKNQDHVHERWGKGREP